MCLFKAYYHISQVQRQDTIMFKMRYNRLHCKEYFSFNYRRRWKAVRKQECLFWRPVNVAGLDKLLESVELPLTDPGLRKFGLGIDSNKSYVSLRHVLSHFSSSKMALYKACMKKCSGFHSLWNLGTFVGLPSWVEVYFLWNWLISNK